MEVEQPGLEPVAQQALALLAVLQQQPPGSRWPVWSFRNEQEDDRSLSLCNSQ